MRRFGLAVSLLLLHASASGAQTLREHFESLYTFGDCGEPLCLHVDGGHGDHFIPNLQAGQANVLAFIDGAIATSLTNLPVTSAASGVRFTFQGGVPVATTLSPGPFFAERSLTLGRGRWLLGASFNGITLSRIRGQELSDLTLRFTHQNVQQPEYGDPEFENDYIEVVTDMDLSLLVTSLYGAFGVTDWADVQVVVPIVRASLAGESVARVHAYNPNNAPHWFGTPGNPQTQATTSTKASVTGVGDIAARAKVNFYQTDELGAGIVADVRIPTGDADNFLGSGNLSVRALGILSGTYGSFSPHVNAGFAYRAAEDRNHSLLATLGFDQMLNENVAFAVELITDLQLGDSKLELPAPVRFDIPAGRELRLTEIPDKADNLVDLALGTKFLLPGSTRALANVLLPLSEGGVRPRMLWTLGIQRNF